MYWVKLDGKGGEKVILVPKKGEKKPQTIMAATHKQRSNPVITWYIEA